MKKKMRTLGGAQFTVRNVPREVQKALKRKALEDKKSLNGVLLDALSRAALGDSEKLFHDLDSLAGTWEEDPAFDEAIAIQDLIDEDLWR